MPPSDSGVGAAVATGGSVVRSATLGGSEETDGAGVDTGTGSAARNITFAGTGGSTLAAGTGTGNAGVGKGCGARAAIRGGGAAAATGDTSGLASAMSITWLIAPRPQG